MLGDLAWSDDDIKMRMAEQDVIEALLPLLLLSAATIPRNTRHER